MEKCIWCQTFLNERLNFRPRTSWGTRRRTTTSRWRSRGCSWRDSPPSRDASSTIQLAQLIVGTLNIVDLTCHQYECCWSCSYRLSTQDIWRSLCRRRPSTTPSATRPCRSSRGSSPGRFTLHTLSHLWCKGPSACDIHEISLSFAPSKFVCIEH